MFRINKLNVFPVCAIIIFTILFIYIGYIYNDYKTNYADIEMRTHYVQNLEWTFIKSILLEDYLAAKNQARSIADILTNNLKNQYSDLSILKDELDSTDKNKNSQYFNVMQSTIRNIYLFNVNKDDNNNNVFICNRYGVLANTSRRARKNIDKFPLLWEEIYREQTNLKLTQEAVNMILQQKDGIIYWEFPNDDVNKIVVPASCDIENLHQLYNQYGIEAFKNIQFLAPAYITTTGDIFGVEDVDFYGNKVQNHKIVVVQTFNLYQQIMARYAGDITEISVFRKNIITHPITSLQINAIFIILVISIMIILICFMLNYNNKQIK